jgi:hypothetical protein
MVWNYVICLPPDARDSGKYSMFWDHLHHHHNQNSLFLLFINLFIRVYIVWAILPTALHSPHPPHPSLPGRTYSALLFNFVEEKIRKIRDNKKDIAFLQVWDKDSYTERFLALLPRTCVLQPELIPDLFTTFQSPCHSDLCQFKMTLLAPSQWAHQPLSSFRFPSLSLFLLYALPLACDPCSSQSEFCILSVKRREWKLGMLICHRIRMKEGNWWSDI